MLSVRACRLAVQNERLTQVLTQVHKEQERMSSQKAMLMESIGLAESLNVTDVLHAEADALQTGI